MGASDPGAQLGSAGFEGNRADDRSEGGRVPIMIILILFCQSMKIKDQSLVLR